MTDKQRLREWAQTWKEVGPELERIRLQEVREQDNRLVLQQLARCFNHATRTQSPGDSSGMVEMQRIFAKLRATGPPT